MEKNLKWYLIAIAIIAVGGYFFPLVQNALGAGTRFPNGISADTTAPSGAGNIRGTTLTLTGASTLGSDGTAINELLYGTCSLIAPSFTVAASTTVSMDCAVTGVASGAIVIGRFATSTVAGNGWAIDGSSASTTAGFLTFRVTNWTGTSAIIPASLASSTQYIVID